MSGLGALFQGIGGGLISSGNWLAKGIEADQRTTKEIELMKMRDELEMNRAIKLDKYKHDEVERRQQAQTEKVNTLAGQAAQQERSANLDQAEQTYRNSGLLDGEDAPAINQALSEARSQPVTPTNRQRLDAQVALGYEKPVTTEKLDAEREATTESRALRQASADETKRYHDALIALGDARVRQADERIQQGEDRSERVTPTQRAKNFGIEASRKAIAGLSKEEIRKRTQQYTNTGRENPDYDSQLAGHVRRANQRKVGDDAWFDQNMLGDENTAPESSPKPIRDNSVIVKEFSADPAMKGNRLGKRTEKGNEVLDQNGKLIGYYQ